MLVSVDCFETDTNRFLELRMQSFGILMRAKSFLRFIGRRWVQMVRFVVEIVILGMFKLVINQLDKIFITSDTATIVKEMEVVHPAAKLVVEAAKKQEEEV